MISLRLVGERSQICFQLKESSTSLSQKPTLCFWRVQRYLKRKVNPFLACWPFSGIGKKPRLWSIRSIHIEDHHCSKEFEHFYTCTCTGVVLGQIEIVCGQSATCLVENLRCRSCSKDPFLAPVTAPLMDRCNFPLPPLSLYIALNINIGKCVSRIFGLITHFPFTWRKSGYNRSSVTNMNKNLNHCTRCICCSGEWV